jgi:hypothetical protein
VPEHEYFVAESPDGKVIGIMSSDEIRRRLAGGTLQSAFVCLPTGATGDLAGQWQPLDLVFGATIPESNRPVTVGIDIRLWRPAVRLLIGIAVIVLVALILSGLAFRYGGDPKAGTFTLAQRARLVNLRPCLPPDLHEYDPYKEISSEQDTGGGPTYTATTVGAKLLELGAWCDNGTLRASDGRPIVLIKAYQVGTGYDPRIAEANREDIQRLRAQGNVVVVMYRITPPS